jgi:hypothetical protein
VNPNASSGHRGVRHGGDAALAARRRASRAQRPRPRSDE